MALSSIFWAAFTYIVSALYVSNAFYLPRTNIHTYSTNDQLFLKVNSLTSISSQIPFSYYSLPYCNPLGGIKKSRENLGQLLLGDQIVNSPYRFEMNVNLTLHLCTTHPLTDPEVKLLKQRIHDMYQVNMILDDLPVTRYAHWNMDYIWWTGFPVGYIDPGTDDYYIINHLKFRVLIHEKENDSGYEIVGFEVVPCSVKYDPRKMRYFHVYENMSRVYCPLDVDKSQLIRPEEQISFTYEVEFLKSYIKGPSMWDAYFRTEDMYFHWFSFANSFIAIIFLGGIIFVIFSRTLKRELLRYQELEKENQANVKEELPRWKLVMGDVFREPNHSKLLCVMVGDGVQILGTAAVTTILAALSSLSPGSRGVLLTRMIYLYMFLGGVGGFVGTRLWINIKGTSEGWRSVSWSIACFFPGIVLVILTALNFILWVSKSTAAIPISLCLLLLSLWLCISIPLTLFGGFLATRTQPIRFPVETSPIPRKIHSNKFKSWLVVLVAGILPFGTLFIELFYMLSNLWLGRFYSTFGFLLIEILMLAIVCVEISLIITYKHLSNEDWRWWWKAFYASSCVALYVFLYSIYYLVFDLKSLNGPASAILYLGHSLIIAIAIMLATGAIGFLSSFYFVRYILYSVKSDLNGDLKHLIAGEDHETSLAKPFEPQAGKA